MSKRSTGRYEQTSVAGEQVAVFVPAPLPPADPAMVLDAVLSRRLHAAEQALTRLELAGEMVPSLDWFIYAFVRIATKLGGKRLPNKGWAPALSPEELRQGCEDDLRTLRLERLDVVHLRWMPNAALPFAEALGVLQELQKAGKICHLALSNVSVPMIEQARQLGATIVAVQNLFNIAGGGGRMAKFAHAEVDDPEGVLAYCEAADIAYLPFSPLGVGTYGREHAALQAVCERYHITPAQAALAWLLARSPVMLPIPGTAHIAHLEENIGALGVTLSAEDMAMISEAARPPTTGKEQ